MEVLVIGPEPPCIRCHTLLRYAKDMETVFPGEVEVRRVSAHSEEAKEYGNVEGGHHIAEAYNVQHDHEKIESLMKEIDELKKDEQKNESSIQEKFQAIDQALQPIKEKAKDEGYLMTPVLVVNGKIKSMDYVPEKETIKEWIESELGH
jgi:hypothetical protein